jgi:hypothetical protein
VYYVTSRDFNFWYPDRVPLNQFVHIAKKKFWHVGLNFLLSFSAPPEFSGGVTEKYLSTGWARTFVLQIMNRISGRFCSYWQPNFPAVSVVTCRDFPAVSAVTGSRIFWPYL